MKTTVLCLLTACGKEVKAPAPEAQKPPAPEQVDTNTCSDALDGIVPQGSYYLHISDIHLDDFGDTLSGKHPDLRRLEPEEWLLPVLDLEPLQAIANDLDALLDLIEVRLLGTRLPLDSRQALTASCWTTSAWTTWPPPWLKQKERQS